MYVLSIVRIPGILDYYRSEDTIAKYYVCKNFALRDFELMGSIYLSKDKGV